MLGFNLPSINQKSRQIGSTGLDIVTFPLGLNGDLREFVLLTQFVGFSLIKVTSQF